MRSNCQTQHAPCTSRRCLRQRDMSLLDEVVQRFSKDEEFKVVLASQSRREPPDLGALCDWCTKWCKQDPGFRKLVHSTLCYTLIKVYNGCLPHIDGSKLSSLCSRGYKQMNFWQRSTSLLGALCLAKQNILKQHYCTQARDGWSHVVTAPWLCR